MDQSYLKPELFLKKGPDCDVRLQIPENSWGGGATARMLSGGMPLQQHICVSFSWKMEQKKRHQEKFQAHLSSFASKQIQRNFGSKRRRLRKTSPEACAAKTSQGIPNKIKRSWQSNTYRGCDLRIIQPHVTDFPEQFCSGS